MQAIAPTVTRRMREESLRAQPVAFLCDRQPALVFARLRKIRALGSRCSGHTRCSRTAGQDYFEMKGSLPMKIRTQKYNKDGALLSNVAESIGAALGTIARKANAAQKVLTQSSVVHSVGREAKQFVRKGKRSARKSGNAVTVKLRRSKLAKAGRRSVRRAASSVKRATRRR